MEERGSEVLLVADSNILFRFLLVSERVRRIVYSLRVVIYTPDWAVVEVNKYLDFIREKLERRGVSSVMLRLVLTELYSRVIVVPKSVYGDKIEEARRIAGLFDPKDAPFIALALKLGVPIWTEDKELIRYGFESGRYIALDTRAIEELLKGGELGEVLEGLKKRI